MSLNLKIFLIIIQIVFFMIIINNIRKKRLLLKYSLLWMGSLFVMTIAIIFPQILERICDILGIELVSNLVFLCGWLISLFLIFSLTIIVSGQGKKITILIEEMRNIK